MKARAADSGREKVPTGEILFGWPDQASPKEVRRAFDAGRRNAHALFMAAWDGPDQEAACDRLVLLGTAICSKLEQLWKDPRRRPLIESAALRANWFPLLQTNLKPLKGAIWLCDEMRATLMQCPAPGQEKAVAGRGAENSRLNREVECFVVGVIRPGSLRRVVVQDGICSEIDLIANSTRSKLLSPKPRATLGKWSAAFVKEYVRPSRPDLLSADGESGELHGIAASLRDDLQAKNPDEKSVWRALEKLVTERLRKFDRLIKSAIPAD